MSKRVFKKLSNVEHVRLRTGMWLGQNSPSVFEQHFIIPQKKGGYQVNHEEIQDVPAKLKCLDEACMNAIDEYNRNLADKKIPRSQKMSRLTVELIKGKRVRVTDNGRGIPHKNAEFVFLHLMYGENFDDQGRQEHITGQNGVGISLVRIVSKYFKAETKYEGNHFSKVFTVTNEFKATCQKLKLSPTLQEKLFLYYDEQGTIKGFPSLNLKMIRPLQAAMKKSGMISKLNFYNDKNEHGTSIEFELDEKYFSNQDISFNEKWIVQYLQDLAMTNSGLTIELITDKKKQAFLFQKGLADIFSQNSLSQYHLNYQTPDKKFKLNAVFLGEGGKTLSWVNSNFVSLGGSAIEYLINRICDEVRKKPAILAYEKKLKTITTRNDVRSCFHIYNDFRLKNPRFKSQDKSYLINNLKEETRDLVDKHLDKLIRKLNLISKIKEEINRRVKIKEIEGVEKDLKKISVTYIPKFIPCTSKSTDKIKTLFIGEGDSAIAGLRPIRDPAVHGLFPLRGKPLNVKGMSLSKILANEEMKNIVSILKLPFNNNKEDKKAKKKISNQSLIKNTINSRKDLTFDRIAIITDADYDGYAIRSLILSFFFEYWPELFTLNMIYIVEAPLYEVELLNLDKKRKVFYCTDDNEYDALMKKAYATQCILIRKKRNKGLGETGKEAMAYAIQKGLIRVEIEDMKEANKVQDIWFHKDRAESRRKEISEYSKLFFEE